MTIGDVVRIVHCEPGGIDRTGMTAHVDDLTPLYAVLALTATGETVEVPRADLMPVEPGPLSVAEWKSIHGTWKRRNARVIARMEARRREAA